MQPCEHKANLLIILWKNLKTYATFTLNLLIGERALMLKLLATVFFALFLTFYFYIVSAEPKPKQRLICQTHPMYCKILEMQPKANKQWAMRFANALIRYGKDYQMDPWLSLAIAMQESSLREIHRKHTTIVFKDQCKKGKCHKTYQIIHGYTDLSIFQFHIATVQAFNFDPIKLSNNLDYAVKSHYKLMQRKLKKCSYLGNEAWSCYHSRTKKYRKRYTKLVKRYYFGKKQILNSTKRSMSPQNALKASS